MASRKAGEENPLNSYTTYIKDTLQFKQYWMLELLFSQIIKHIQMSLHSPEMEVLFVFQIPSN